MWIGRQFKNEEGKNKIAEERLKKLRREINKIVEEEENKNEKGTGR